MISFLNRFLTEYILYLFLIIFSAGAAVFLDNKIFIIVIFSYTLLLYIKKFKTINSSIVIFLLLWVVVNATAYVVFGNIVDAQLITFLSVTSRMLLPYFILRLFKESFFDSIERIIFSLSLISLPIFALQLLQPNIFYGFASLLNFMTDDEQKMFGGWYIGVYMFNSWASDRNSGFMWEPGAFAFMAIIGMLIRYSKNGLRLDKYIIVYVVSILSTFSTMGYTVLLLFILATFLRTERFFVYLFLVPGFFVITFSNVLQLDFMMPKVEKYAEDVDRIYRSSETSGAVLRANRFGILKFAFEESLKWPFGFGILEATPSYMVYKESVKGPNTYAQILLRWGWLGIFLYFIASYRLIFRLFVNSPKVARITLLAGFLAAVSSYNLINNTILLALLYYPFITYESITYQHNK